MSTIYRSYEVLIEETAENHKTRKSKKTNKQLKLHHKNTERALKVTHELFQDAVCYYIFCLIGLVKNEKEKDEPINRLWEYLHNAEMAQKTQEVLERLTTLYPKAPFYKAESVEKFLSKTYGWLETEGKEPTPAELRETYKILFKAATKGGIGKEDEAASLESLKTFSRTWLGNLCNVDGKATLLGKGTWDQLHRDLNGSTTSELVWSVVNKAVDQASQRQVKEDDTWKKSEKDKASGKNAKVKKKKTEEDLAKEFEKNGKQKRRALNKC